MSAGTSRLVSLETSTIKVMASGTAQIAGCSQRILSNGCIAQKPSSGSHFKSVKLVKEIPARASNPPVNIPVAAPFIVMRNTLAGAKIERRRFEFVMVATIIAGFWSLMSGTFFLMTLRAAGVLA